ncbi:MAG: hypothetical protein KJI70_01450 [Patescibacteria group bacterium]|nr:hypothetical protein [Patescibacteria group bacterium]
MEAFLTFIIIIALLFSFASSPAKKPTDVNEEPAVQDVIYTASLVQPSQTIQSQPAIQQPTINLIDTYIVSGPEQGEILKNTNSVVFEFDANILSDNLKGKLYFETKVLGFDNDWKKTSAKKRTIVLPSGSNQYTFLVRAKINKTVDLTPAQRAFTLNISPYFKKVKISTIQYESTSRPALITLITNLNQNEEINITGWSIESKNGKIVIPQATEKYYHYYGSHNNEDIIIKKGERIYLSSGYNPLGRDRNFKDNKCMGYLTNSFDFPVSISKKCPKPTAQEVSHLDPCCQQFILKLKSCQYPDYSEDADVRSDKQCTEYIDENLNNIGCFMNHSQDKYFLGNNWYIYLHGKNILADDCYDTLYLKDKNGLVINTYPYGKPVCK